MGSGEALANFTCVSKMLSKAGTLIRVEVAVDLAWLLEAAESRATEELEADDGLMDFSDEGAVLQATRTAVDVDDLPLAAVVFAYSKAPTIAPVQMPGPAVIGRRSAAAKAYNKQKHKKRNAGAQAMHIGPKSTIDEKLSNLWRACVTVSITQVDLESVRMPKTHYTGNHTDLPDICRFALPLLVQLIAAGFKLVRWNAKYV